MLCPENLLICLFSPQKMVLKEIRRKKVLFAHSNSFLLITLCAIVCQWFLHRVRQLLPPPSFFCMDVCDRGVSHYHGHLLLVAQELAHSALERPLLAGVSTTVTDFFSPHLGTSLPQCPPTPGSCPSGNPQPPMPTLHQ